MSLPPMVAIVGKKHSGKTTLVVRLADALRARGHVVGIIKHGSHTFNLDPASTDTYRHYHEGGAAKVAMISPDKFALIERHAEEPSPDAVAARHMADADVVLCEGFTRGPLPKIEIHRAAAHPRPIADADRGGTLLARVTDDPGHAAPCPVFLLSDPDWLPRLTTLVERSLPIRP